jgi:nucleotide-binding universal stress UspA family protein
MIQANPIGILLALIFISSLGSLFFWMFRVPPPVPLSVARVHRSLEAVRKILIPIIEAISSERAVELACRLANGKKSEIILVHVMEVPYTMPLNAPMPAQEKRAREALDLGVLIGQRHGCHVQTQLIRHRNAADGILEMARAENVDAILLGVGTKTRVPGEWGKTAVAILNRAVCEVIVDKVPIAAQPMALNPPVKAA